MKLAFYYHIPISKQGENLYLPGHFGIFIDELAANVNELVLLMHEATEYETRTNDYKLMSSNIRFLNLGYTTPAWHRGIFHKRFLKPFESILNECDVVLLRMPCALAPFFSKYVKDPQKLWFMAVGDYSEGARNWPHNNIRNIAIKYYLHLNNWLFTRKLKHYNLLVNSEKLLFKYDGKCRRLSKISTSTLRTKDFFLRTDTCNNDTINLVYTGRIDPAKGLFELVEAASALIKEGIRINLHIAGWELKEGERIRKELIKLSEKLGIQNSVTFHGKLNVGAELNSLYRKGDLFIIPSYYEGFPRVIWEAMANSLPVITTDVGGIPAVLSHMTNALFIKPKSIEAIIDAVKTLINDQSLRQKLIFRGNEIALQNTLETHTQKLVKQFVSEN